MNCQDRVFPSSERRGGCAVKKMLRSLLMKAQTGWAVPDKVTKSTCTIMTTPSSPLRRLRAFFLLAQPRLLFQEGNTLSWQFIHTFIELRKLCSIGLFQRRGEHHIGELRIDLVFDLAEHVEFTAFGRRWANRLAQL